MWRDYEVQAVLIDSPFDLGNALRGHRRASKEHLDAALLTKPVEQFNGFD